MGLELVMHSPAARCKSTLSTEILSKPPVLTLTAQVPSAVRVNTDTRQQQEGLWRQVVWREWVTWVVPQTESNL